MSFENGVTGSPARPALLPLGHVAATPGAVEALEVQAGALAPVLAAALLSRHARGDWGDLDAHDRGVNEVAVQNGYRVMSEYRLGTGAKIWIITEADRSMTTLLVPNDY